MGKKTRKTRWRTLSIGTQSDSDSLVNGEEDNTRQKSNQRHGRFQQRFYTQNNNSTPKYNNHYSSHSTPTRQYNNNGYHNKYQTSKSTTRSSSTTSENKITFNEEEYTRITTPRQDVLFKKGYLSKPKPYLQQQQQQLTSTGNSTGDGTPDHQSADGTEGGDLGEFEQPPFVFPGSYLDHHSTIYYVNGYEPYAAAAAAAAASASHHPMVMYNPALCYPYVTGTGDATRVKRYSTDSMTDSTSPSNECQDDVASEFNTIPPCFIYNTGFSPVYDVPPPQTDITPATETTDDCVSAEETNKQNPPLKKKRSRRKSDAENNENEEECSTDDESKSHDEAGATSADLDVSSSGSNVPPDVSQETDTTTTSAKYRVDAEEFVPRAYRATPAALPPGFVSMPLCPDMMFIPPGIMMAPPPGPHFISGRFYDMNPFYQQPRIQEGEDTTTLTTMNKEIEDVDENLDKQTENNVEATKQVENDRVIEEEINNDETAVDSKPITKQVVPSEKAAAPPHAIDIAKIVSKLEEAALEQKRLETEAQQPKSKRDEEEISEKSQKYLEMHPRTTTRRAPQHRERRTHLNSTNKKSETSVTTERKTNYKTEPATRYTTANSTTEPLLNINHNNNTSSPTVQAPPATEPSPSVLPAPLPTFTEKLKSTSRKSTPAKATVVAPCPRLQRVRSRPEPEVRSARTPVQVVPVAVQPRATAPDAWISVSSKKKRKTKNQDDVEEETIDTKEEIKPIVQEVDVKTVEIEQPQEPDVQKTEEVMIEKELEILEDESPIKKQNNNKLKKPRRKIIINDEALLMNGKEATTAAVTTQVVQVEKKPKEVKSKVTTIVESYTPAIVIPHIEVMPGQEALAHVPCSKSKKKKKRTNNKVHSDQPENLDVSCDDSSSTSTTTDNFNDASSKTNVEVSLEIDRMIQRGLYANLEEKIRLFNPSDSFIHASTDKVDVDANAVMEGFSFDMVKSLESNSVKNNNNNFKNFDFSGILFNGTTINQTLQRAMSTKTVLKSVTTAPNVCYVPKTTSNHQTDDSTTELTVTELVTSPDTIESLTLDEPTTTITATDSVARLQITRAVKEWMNRTRENTPEIEIFKNPQELRQEFLLSDVEDDSDETISASREGSADLLECWEEPQVLHVEEHPVAVVVQPEPAIEQGEDALEVYESVYGKNADYLRIKSEVKEAGATPHIPAAATRAPFGVRDGGLPYRAICCTVM